MPLFLDKWFSMLDAQYWILDDIQNRLQILIFYIENRISRIEYRISSIRLYQEFSSMNLSHEIYMHKALVEAEKAGQMGEVPVGAILVAEDGNILSSDHNRTIAMADPTAHAEILALRQAAIKINNYRLLETSLFVTV